MKTAYAVLIGDEWHIAHLVPREEYGRRSHELTEETMVWSDARSTGFLGPESKAALVVNLPNLDDGESDG